MPTTELHPRRIELILRQVESLPTLPAVAARLLELTASDDAHARQVVELVSADPALTAKVLRLCRSADKGLRDQVQTVDRAVVLLGFNAIRNTVLSVKVFELFADPRKVGDGDDDGDRFNHHGYWLHSLAVGVLAERIARAHKTRRDLYPDEAFVCGLLHDIGKLALDYVLPRSYARVVELADFNQGDIAEFERRIIGLDHHTAGKRLAEQWRLPHRLQDTIWLHGATYDTIPALEHRNFVALIALADLLARRQHVGYSGNHRLVPDASLWIERMNLDAARVDAAVAGLHEDLDERAKALGLGDVPTRAVFLQSIQRANEELGRVNQQLERRTRLTQQQTRALEAITAFHGAAVPGRSAADVLDAVVDSARTTLGEGFYAMIVPATDPTGVDPGSWLVCQYNHDGQAAHAQEIDPPPHAPSWQELGDEGALGVAATGILPWVTDYLMNAEDVRRVKLLPLTCGWGASALLLHDHAQLPPWPVLGPLCATWGAAIAAAQQHEGARRLGEQLAEANAQLAAAQDRLLRTESLTRLGEMAAGAAHEMNNPLAVISGRSQLLMMSLPKMSKQHKAAQTIYTEAHRISDLITALHMFAEPPRAKRHPTDVSALLDEVVRDVRRAMQNDDYEPAVTLRIAQPMEEVDVDAAMVSRAVRELLTNALQARPRGETVVQALRAPDNGDLIVRVIDDGVGMDGHTLAHAFDPFFSALPAGRRVGMGLSRAQQLAHAHGGTLELSSLPGEGTTATLRLPVRGC